jgi:hypothetical protein
MTHKSPHVEITNEDSSHQAYYVEIMKRLHEAVCRKKPKLWPNSWIVHYNAPAHKVLSLKQFLAQKSIANMEHPPFHPYLAPSDFWLFTKIKPTQKEISGY